MRRAAHFLQTSKVCVCPTFIHYSDEATNGQQDAQVSLLEPFLTDLLHSFIHPPTVNYSICADQ